MDSIGTETSLGDRQARSRVEDELTRLAGGWTVGDRLLFMEVAIGAAALWFFMIFSGLNRAPASGSEHNEFNIALSFLARNDSVVFPKAALLLGAIALLLEVVRRACK